MVRHQGSIDTQPVIIIGQIIGSENLEVDFPTLVDTQLLIQASSGGDK